LFVKNTSKIKISASQRIPFKNWMNYDHNKNVGLSKFQSGYRKLYLNSLNGYSLKIINAQTDTDLAIGVGGVDVSQLLLQHVQLPLLRLQEVVRHLGCREYHGSS